MERVEKRRTFEQHVQTVALALITAGLIWVGATLRDMYDSQIQLQEQMIGMKADIRDVRTQLDEVPTHREIDARLEAVDQRLDNLEAGQ